MKAIFYPRTLFESTMTTTDRLVYSQLLYRSLWDNYESFDVDGAFTTEIYTSEYDGFVPIGWSATEQIIHNLNISKRSFYLSKQRLKEQGYIVGGESGDRIYIIPNVTVNYVELEYKTGLSGMNLIVYSYLNQKCKEYGWIDKYHVALAKELGISRPRLENIVSVLQDGGFLNKKSKGHQMLLRTT